MKREFIKRVAAAQGQARSSKVKQGQARSSKVKQGQARSSKVKQGQACGGGQTRLKRCGKFTPSGKANSRQIQAKFSQAKKAFFKS
ncbi:hypothetical protein ACB557_001761 [Campylobacter upsaliensis]